MYMLFTRSKGREGFTFSDSKKVYFPDKSVKMKSYLVKVSRIKDKGTYGFVVGESISCDRVMPVVEAVKAGIISVLDVHHIKSYRWDEESCIEFWTDKNEREYYAVVDGRVEVIYTVPEEEEGREYYSHKYANELLKSCRDIVLEEVFSDLPREIFLEIIHGADGFNMYESFEEVIKYFSDGVRGMVRLYRDRLLKIKPWGYSNYVFAFIYLRDELRLIPNWVVRAMDKYNLLGSGIDVSDFYMDMSKELKICFTSPMSSDEIVEKMVSGLGVKLGVKFFNNKVFSYKTYEMCKEDVEKTHEVYNKEREQVAKKVSSRSVGELRKLSLYDLQFGTMVNIIGSSL